MPERSSRRWFVISSILLGMIALISAVSPFMALVVHRYVPGGSSILPLGATLVFLFLSGFNALLARAGKPPITTPAESLGCFAVLLMANWAIGYSFVEAQMPLLTSPPVFGTPDSGWVEHVIPYLPAWAMGPTVEPYATGFYNGLRPGIPIPWGLWVVPVMAWTAFAVVLTLFCVGIASILSRQWVEHDRLTFPHAEVLLGISRGFMSNRMFWWGFALAAAIPLWNVLQKIWPILPQISLYFGGDGNGVEWFKGAWKIVPVLNIALLGLFYFVHRDILVSMVIFFFVLAIEQYGMGIGGYTLEHGDVLGSADPILWQNAGALTMMVLLSLWAGRHSLARFIRAGIRGQEEEAAWISPRAGLVALVIGSVGVTVWMVLLGLREPGPLAAFMVTKFIGFIGMARVTMESAMEVNWPVAANDFAVLVGGTGAIAPAGFAALALSLCWLTASAWMGQVTYVMQTEKFRSQFAFPRGLLVTVLIGVALATAVTMYSTAWLGYTRGANNFGNWNYQWHMRIPYNQAAESVRNAPVPPDPKRFGWLGAGMGIVGGMVYLRTRVVGWFLHPVGFILASMGMPGGAKGNIFIFTAILVWIIKTLILRLGGVESYEKYKALFAGVVVGHFAPDLLGGILDVIWFINTGHRLE